MLIAKNDTTIAPTAIRPAGRSLNTWQAVQDEILRRIRTGIWAAGQLIPTEHQLAAELGCARATVNRALSQLAEDGIVKRRRRVGTRVADTSIPEAGVGASLIREEVESCGSSYTYELTERDVVRAPDRIAAVMHVSQTEPLIRYRALIKADDSPYCVEVGYLSAQGTKGLTEDLIRRAEPLEWMRKNVSQLSGRMEVLATRLNTECAGDLGVERGLPVLTLDRTLWCGARALSHSRRVYPPGHKVSFAR
ncbi:GntR family transcriptional regulator [Paracoccus aerodenitrificans]|uniref:GntR family transcriptional regulator n=1 Tax=Paracoccus aerodenitrificans TaxID=3017781 RepID=UPI0022F12E4E|nr:GntR family transcriptional regulator [Paracoccus aerodenitrificans]WBU63285.1 GntR family transcriptional regulator [Paracoccus aerodenitrificans]